MSIDAHPRSGSADSGPRICLPTARRISCKVFETGFYEAQDVLRTSANVDMVALEPAAGFRVRERWHRRLAHRDPTNRAALLNPGLKRERLSQDYDVFLASCQSYEDLLYINAIDNWKDRCRVSACWIDELWAVSIPRYRHWMSAFAKFDHIFLAHRSAVKDLAEATGRPCHWLPAGVDALRFSPYPAPPPRSIGVYSVGRRQVGMHDVLIELARTSRLHYVYDTSKTAVTDAYDAVQHRELFANTAKRSRFFIVAPPKFDAPRETAGEVEIGYRYYEGAAAGAVMLGQRPATSTFDELFDWPDAVVETAPDGSDLASTIAELEATPERLAAISHQNVVAALMRHDWSYRWAEILATVGLPVPDALLNRQTTLHELASTADDGSTWGSPVARVSARRAILGR